MKPEDYLQQIFKSISEAYYVYLLFKGLRFVISVLLVVGFIFWFYQTFDLGAPKSKDYKPSCTITYDMQTGEPIEPDFSPECNFGYWGRVGILLEWQELHRNWREENSK